MAAKYNIAVNQSLSPLIWRGECLVFVPFLIRHFSLACLIAALFFSPTVSFATTVQGTKIYSSSAAAQTQINILIAADIAAHPGATQNGNTVQWDEVNRRVSKSYFIRIGSINLMRQVYSVRYSHNFPSFPTYYIHPIIILPSAEAITQYYNYRQELINDYLNGSSFPAKITDGADTYTFLGKSFNDNTGYSSSAFGMEAVYVKNGRDYGYSLFVEASLSPPFDYTPYYIDYQDTDSQLTLTLSGGASTEPGKSLPLTATVTDQNNIPQSGVVVKISLKVDPTSGGHDHGDSTRPRGKLSGTACTSDAICLTSTTNGSGVASFSFDAPGASGKHAITATCDKCTNSPQTAKVDVKVEGLEPIPASLFYVLIGATDKHSDNHYLTKDAAAILRSIAAAYHAESRFKLDGVAPPLLHLNDASLVWGGIFDAINSNWKKPHAEHRRGTVIDIRANLATGAIPTRNFAVFKQLAIDMGADPHFENKGTPNQHFHLRIFNRKE